MEQVSRVEKIYLDRITRSCRNYWHFEQYVIALLIQGPQKDRASGVLK
jgi:hypothetical protein